MVSLNVEKREGRMRTVKEIMSKRGNTENETQMNTGGKKERSKYHVD
jgi:hypothetical protein